MSTVAVDGLAVLPFIRMEVLGERVVQLQPYHDGSTWHTWVPTAEGHLQELASPEFLEGTYFAAAPARETDVRLLFLEFVVKIPASRRLSASPLGFAPMS
jgi:hypothetical protein